MKQFTLSLLGSGLLLSVGVVVRIVVVDLEINIFLNNQIKFSIGQDSGGNSDYFSIYYGKTLVQTWLL